jgi:hypothetical protein
MDPSDAAVVSGVLHLTKYTLPTEIEGKNQREREPEALEFLLLSPCSSASSTIGNPVYPAPPAT